jgi:sugar O-acyltransferase (sialic acid O-acetyltransferase NeuD family)
MEDTQFNNNGTIIIGASGLARELESWISLSGQSKDYNIIGFLDDNKQALLNYKISLPLLGDIDFCKIDYGVSVLLAISECDIKEKLFQQALQSNVIISSYFHETARVGLRTFLGIGVIFFPNAIVSCDTNIGNGVFINNGSQIGHDVTIGDFCSIMANVDVGGGAQIGKSVFIGSSTVILPGVKIPAYTRIGAGSVVIKSIKQVGTYFGNPAKKIF